MTSQWKLESAPSLDADAHAVPPDFGTCQVKMLYDNVPMQIEADETVFAQPVCEHDCRASGVIDVHRSCML
jgi:hypothetical protein